MEFHPDLFENTIGVAAAVKKFDWLATEFAASRAQPGGQTWAASEFAISPNSPKTGLPHSWTVNLSDNVVLFGFSCKCHQHLHLDSS